MNNVLNLPQQNKCKVSTCGFSFFPHKVVLIEIVLGFFYFLFYLIHAGFGHFLNFKPLRIFLGGLEAQL